MKKVWVLERFSTADELRAGVESAKEYVKKCEDQFPEHLKSAEDRLTYAIETCHNNPEGFWVGWEGKTDYKVFCRVAKDALRRDRKASYRVVSAELKDDAKTWLGYVNSVVNEGVMRYLYATC